MEFNVCQWKRLLQVPCRLDDMIYKRCIHERIELATRRWRVLISEKRHRIFSRLLGSLLFLIYKAPISDIFSQQNMNVRLYSDDTQSPNQCGAR